MFNRFETRSLLALVFLYATRMLGLFMVLPVLALFAPQYAGSTTFWVGIIKAPVFAAVIALVGTLRGLQVRGSSRELGRLTTVAVVQSIFLVILFDAVFAVLFMELDI